jgi:hypothetical protein
MVPARDVAEYAWSEVFDRAVRAFGNTTPGAALEVELRECFEESPALVVGTVDAVAEAFKAGRVFSPWAILRARLRSGASPVELIVSDESERERAIGRAENLLRAIGHELDREPEVIATLFTDAGERSNAVLGRWADDEELKDRMLELWRELRPKVAA